MSDTFVLGGIDVSPPVLHLESFGSDDPKEALRSYAIEVANCYIAMKQFNITDTLTVFQSLSQFTARASEIRSQIVLHETKAQAAFRIKILDPFIEECDRQFRFHSRIQATHEIDARLAGGRFT